MMNTLCIYVERKKKYAKRQELWDMFRSINEILTLEIVRSRVKNGRYVIDQIKEMLDNIIKENPYENKYSCIIDDNVFRECIVINLEKEGLVDYYKRKGFKSYQIEDKLNNKIVYELIRTRQSFTNHLTKEGI